MSEKQLFKVHRPIMLRGTEYQAGDVIDLAPMGLPPGRGQQFVDQRRGEWVSTSDEVIVPDTANDVINDWVVQDAPLDPDPEPIELDADSDDGLSEPLSVDQALVESWQTMTHRELQKAAKARGLPGDGKTEDLRDRLLESLY